jgi:hypothetical protein
MQPVNWNHTEAVRAERESEISIDLLTEPTAKPILAAPQTRGQSAGANAPAMLDAERNSTRAEVIPASALESTIIQTSHGQEQLPTELDAEEDLRLTPMSELEGTVREVMPAGSDEAPVSLPSEESSRLPSLPAHAAEPTVQSLDELTLHPREVASSSSFQKKATAAPGTMLYR